MSYDTIEGSIEDGRPIYLYRFTLQQTVWRFTSRDRDYLDVDGMLWKSVAISDDGPSYSGEATTDMLTVTLPITAGPVQVHLNVPPASQIRLAILRANEGNTQRKVVYSGDVTQCSPAATGTATLSCETLTSSLAREGLRLGYQRSCPYALYQASTCRVPMSAHEYTARVLDRSDYSLITDITGITEGFFTGGLISWQHPVRGTEFRGVEEHGSNVLIILGRVDDIYPGLQLKVYPGCNRTTDHCKNRFNNLSNMGGFPGMPGKSPFDGNPVF